jgi:DNA-binding NarL/FixJ family response regulator
MSMPLTCATLPCMAISVLIVDDHAGFRTFARALLRSEGFEVVGESGDGESAMRAVEQLRPDLVLLDVQLPDLDGFEVAERLAADENPPAVVLVSTRQAASYRARLAETSARAFIAKEELSGPALAAVLRT